MKDILNQKKLIFTLIILSVLVMLPGCVSYRIIPASDLPNYTKYHFKVISKSENFNLVNAEVSNNVLTGKIDKTKSYSNNIIKVYLSSGSLLKIGAENSVSIPLDRVAKIEKSDFGMEKNAPAPKINKTKTPVTKVLRGILYIVLTIVSISLMAEKWR